MLASSYHSPQAMPVELQSTSEPTFLVTVLYSQNDFSEQNLQIGHTPCSSGHYTIDIPVIYTYTNLHENILGPADRPCACGYPLDNYDYSALEVVEDGTDILDKKRKKNPHRLVRNYKLLTFF